MTQSQQAAVDLFLQAHPGFQAAGCPALTLTDDACKQAYGEWESIVHGAKAELQFPFAAWGDFNQDGLPDFVVPFFGSTAVNNFGWRQWLLVVFEGVPDGSFKPVIAAKDAWGTCFDGMLFEPARKQIEFWCGSGGGSFRWTGSHYQSKPLRGD